MKTYLADIIPKIKKYSQKLDNLTLLTNQHWVVIDELKDRKSVYIFRDNNQLLISNNGKVEKAKWEYLGNDSILIERKDEAFLLRHGFFDEHVLALKIDGQEGFVILANETKFKNEINSLSEVMLFLKECYLSPSIQSKYKELIVDGNEDDIETKFGTFKKNVSKVSTAFCLGCRRVDKASDLYYCSTSGIYFHHNCLMKYIEKNR